MPDAPGPIPGVTRADHFGVTVPNLAEAHEFFVDVLGCEYMYELGPFTHDDHWMSEHLNVADDTVMRRLHFFRLGGQAIFEVFEYEATDQQRTPPRNSDVGGHHIALYVTDLDAAVAQLHRLGLTVFGEPTGARVCRPPQLAAADAARSWRCSSTSSTMPYSIASVAPRM